MIKLSTERFGSVRGFLLGLVLIPILAVAEDTDVYTPPIDPDFRPSVMFMIDSSKSMKFTGEAWKPWRFDRLKTPLISFLRTSGDLKVGLSSFNGNNRGGAIISPVANLDKDLCPDANCDEITLRSQIQRDTDDGYEISKTGRIQLYSGAMNYGAYSDNYGSAGWYLTKEGESMVETAGQKMFEAEVLPLFVNQEGDKTIVGLHWPRIRTSADAEIYYATLRFGWPGDEFLDVDAGEGMGEVKATISLDSRENSPPFADAAGQRVSDRPYLADTIPWTIKRNPNWDREIDAEKTVVTPSFHELLNQAIPAGYDGSMTIKLELEPGALADKFHAINLLGVHDRGAQLAKPRFVYYHKFDRPVQPRLAVHRFDLLNIPRGAKITKAHMETSTWQNPREVDPARLNIRAEDSGNSPSLVATRYSLSARERTSAEVNWNPERWHGDNSRKRTPDISALVQEVIDRDDWCAGNALTLFIDGEGTRYGWNHEAGKLRAASIHVSYDPKSVDVNNNCRSAVGKEALVMYADDSVIEEPDRTLHLGEPAFETGNQNKWLGLKFDNTQLSPGDKISDATLSLTNVIKTNYRVNMEVVVADSNFDVGYEVDGVRTKFVGTVNPSLRFLTSPLSEGDRIESTDISSLIQDAIDSPDWSRDSTLYIGIRRVGGLNTTLVTSHGAGGEAPALNITKQVSGAAAANIPLRTARDEIIEKIETLPATGNTPLVDALLETAAYMRGDEVLHGMRRGEKKKYNNEHRVSSSESYTGGTLYRPFDCSADKLDDVACVTETILGTATYDKPESSECRANQIILVTDGDPTTSTARGATSARIKSMTGDTTCESSPTSQECALELAKHLADTDTEHHPVKLSTIGFDFYSGFLSSLASAGGGDFHSVASTGQMSAALRAIGNDIEHDVATTVAPVAAISQFNRATHRDELYFALFTPAYKQSLWSGNVKRYRLGKLPDSERIGVLDANGKAVLDTEIGSISTSARSFWSHTIDGSNVAKGGIAEQLPLYRNILTWPKPSKRNNQGAQELVAFNPDNKKIRSRDLVVPASERVSAINWMRGFDVLDENDNGVFNEPRKSVGAAMHSTPTILNYGSKESPGISVVFAGTHEGYLHGVESEFGKELFAFIPYELYKNVGKHFGGQPFDMQHGVDGPITVWADDKNKDGMIDKDAGEKAWVTFGLRRGGMHYYTLDVSDPLEPSLAWSIGNTRKGFEDLHQTWSKATHARIKQKYRGKVELRDVLIFGNGYNTINDELERNPDTAHADSGAVYIVDAKTGDLIYRLDSTDHEELKWSIPADISAIDIDFNGVVDFLIFADLGGNVWRADMPAEPDKSGLVVTSKPKLSLAAKLASRTDSWSGSAYNAAGDRRFFHGPDIAYMSAPDGHKYLGVVIGSGRRDHPLGNATDNRLYSLHLDPYAPLSETITEDNLFDASEDIAQLSDSHHGWFIDLKHDGEKMLGSPVILAGRIMATTYVPELTSDSDCDPQLGSGRLYVVDAFTAKGLIESSNSQYEVDSDDRSRELESNGIPPPISIFVNDNNVDKPVALVGMEGVEGVEDVPQRNNTYWVEY